MPEKIVEIESLSKHYKKRTGLFSAENILAVDNLNLTIGRGEIFALLGPNGAGKTTTLNIISGLIKPSAGQIKVFGKNLNFKEIEDKFKIGYLTEDNVLPDYISLKELFGFLANIFNLSPEIKKKRIAWLVEQLGLKDLLKKRIGFFSAGQKRLAALACAFINEPELFILDEPTVYLDPLGARRLGEMITNFRKQGKTVIISSHILSQVEKLCDHIAILKSGKLKFSGESKTLAQKGSLDDCFIELTSD